MTSGGAGLAYRLVEAGIPVVVCHPNREYPADGRSDVIPPRQWHLAEPDLAALSGYRPGEHVLAMVTGRGVDVVDLDAKTGAELGWLPNPPEYGLDLTPGGGWHVPVPSSGYGRGVLRIAGRVAGDYLGGTAEGGARGLCYLPGSARPKYPGVDYRTAVEWDLPRLLEAEPDPLLVGILESGGLSTTGGAGVAGGQPGDIAAFFDSVPPPTRCGYGRAAVDGLLAESPQVGGRHGWGMRAVARVTELMAAGCVDPAALVQIRERFREVKPEAPKGEFTDLLLWAVNNCSVAVPCDHLPALTPLLPTFEAPTGQVRVGADWEPVALSTTVSVRPSLMCRVDGPGLLYPGLVHSIAGESESFKSGLVLWETAKVAEAGGRVLYLDFESDAVSVGTRLAGFGLDERQMQAGVVYVRPSSGFHPERIEQYLGSRFDLVVLDGVTEFLSMSGGDTNSGDAVARLYQQLPVRVADLTGAAVVLIDHVSKNPERGRFPIGSQHKLAALTGAGYLIRPRSALQPGQTGWIDLEVVKDRPGQVRANSAPSEPGSRVQLAAAIELDSTAEPTRLTIHPPSGANRSAPTHLLAAISGWVGRQGRPVPEAEIEIVFRADETRHTLDVLCTHGYLDLLDHGGGRRSYRYRKSFIIGVDQPL